ncbi:MAG: methyltransferase domain-containing protein [Myxococcota bacterium]
MWDPIQYAQFSDERSRPFYDLFGRISGLTPRHAVDLGCGSGELTRLILKRWRGCQVLGLDSSPSMLALAAEYAVPGQLRFEQRDLATWQAQTPLDLVLSNAALQWVPSHERLIPQLASQVAPKGVLAVQMPDNFDAPSHRLVRAVAQDGPWATTLAEFNERRFVKPLSWYMETLQQLGFSVDAWSTEYFHVLQGADPVLEWIRGTALRPYLQRLEGTPWRTAFETTLAETLREAYPATTHGTVFPFRRLFFVAVKR